MKNILTAFFMAWGNFISIPCPVKRWDDNLKKDMLKMLPAVGLIVGSLWFGLALGLNLLRLPVVFIGFILTVYIYGVTGYFHLDGFMDVRDAIMSRRDIEERQRILKDSRVGAFAVISVVLLIVGMFACLTAYTYMVREYGEVSEGKPSWIFYLPLIVIPVVSRYEGGVGVLTFEPMESSQYAEADREKALPKLMIAQMLIFILIPFYIALAFGGEGLEIKIILLFVLAWTLVLGSSYIAMKRASKQLGGMNGDIAGYGICISELVGMIVLVLVMRV